MWLLFFIHENESTKLQGSSGPFKGENLPNDFIQVIRQKPIIFFNIWRKFYVRKSFSKIFFFIEPGIYLDFDSTVCNLCKMCVY